MKDTLQGIGSVLERYAPDMLMIACLSLMFAFLFAFFLQPVEPYPITGEVTDLIYEGASTTVGTGSGVTADGKPITQVTVNSTDDTWTVVLFVDGEHKSYTVDAAQYYNLEIGDFVALDCTRGVWVPVVDCER